MSEQVTTQIDCPNCDNQLSVADSRCGMCGVDVAFAAAREERTYLERPTLPTAPEALLPRLGELLVEAGLVTQSELQHTLAEQKRRAAAGQRVLVGQLMVELGYIDRAALDRVVARHIFQLQGALHDTNARLEQRVRDRTAALHNALIRLSELSELKSNFISNVSHELRTPLQYLTSYSEIMLEGSLGPLTQSQHDAVDAMYHATGRLRELIEELLSFSEVANGETQVRVRSLEIEVPVRNAVRQSVPKARARNLGFRTRMARSIPMVQADERKITWVIGELLDNAIKFTPEGGLVALAASYHDRRVRVAVKDTGIGIATERMAEIFEPFHQLDGSTTRKYSGMGLGLALAQQIVQAHGSTIEVSSEPGVGSVFSFALPASA